MYETDLYRSRDLDDVIQREQEVREQEEDTSEVPILDQPSSTTTKGKGIQPMQDDRQEVLGDMSVSTGQKKDHEAPSSADISDREELTMEESVDPDAEELDNLPDEFTPIIAGWGNQR